MRSGSTSAAESLGAKSFQTSGCSAGMMQSEAVIMITLRCECYPQRRFGSWSSRSNAVLVGTGLLTVSARVPDHLAAWLAKYGRRRSSRLHVPCDFLPL